MYIGNLLQKSLNFILNLFLVVIIVDPVDSILKLKIPLFALVVLFCSLTYPLFKIKYLLPIYIIYSILIVTSLFGLLFDNKYDYPFMIYCYKTFIMSILLLWIDRIQLLDRLSVPIVIVSLICIVLYLVLVINPYLSSPIYAFFYVNDKYPIMLSHRNFLGIDMLSVYYKSCMLFFIPLSLYIYRFFNEKRKKMSNFLMATLSFLVLLISGTRANILGAVMLVLLFLLMKMWRYKWSRQLSFFLIITVFIGIVVLMNAILLDNEKSVVVKLSLLNSFNELIQEKPQILIFGQGVGATFDSGSMAHGETPQMEWTYLEFIRLFGGPLALVLLFIYYYPLYLMYKYRHQLQYYLPVFIGYLMYLLVAATNPYLLSSNGLLAMLIAYSYSLNPIYRIKNEKSIDGYSSL